MRLQPVDEIFKPLVFCVMPYGVRCHPETGQSTDFDRVYRELMVPAAEAAGCRAIRSDHEMSGGMIHTSMFERLLLADVVVADISIPNPNVFYELGIRHATRPRATITIGNLSGAYIPFDIAPLRHLTYTLDEDTSGGDGFRAILAERIQSGTKELTMVDSPLFSLVAGYPGIELSHEHAESYRDRVNSILTWRSQLSLAVGQKDRAGVDELVETCGGNLELIVDAVLAYRDLEAYDSMIQLIEANERFASSGSGIELAAFARNRRGLPGDRVYALQTLEELVQREGMTSERGSLMGRIHKDGWLEARTQGSKEAKPLLYRAIDAYRRGFEADPRDPYPGVNAVTLCALAGLESELTKISPVVAFAIARRGGLQVRDYFDMAALCELCCATGDEDTAREAAMLALGKPHPTWARASTARNLRLLGEVRPLAGELSTLFE